MEVLNGYVARAVEVYEARLRVEAQNKRYCACVKDIKAMCNMYMKGNNVSCFKVNDTLYINRVKKRVNQQQLTPELFAHISCDETFVDMSELSETDVASVVRGKLTCEEETYVTFMNKPPRNADVITSGHDTLFKMGSAVSNAQSEYDRETLADRDSIKERDTQMRDMAEDIAGSVGVDKCVSADVRGYNVFVMPTRISRHRSARRDTVVKLAAQAIIETKDMDAAIRPSHVYVLMNDYLQDHAKHACEEMLIVKNVVVPHCTPSDQPGQM